MALLAAGIYKSIYGLRCNNFKGAFSRSTCSYEAVSRVSRINHKIPVRRRPSRRRIYSSRADFSLGAPARALQCLCSAEESEGVEVGIGRARGKTRLEKEKPTRELFPRYRAQRPACNVRVSAAGVSGSLALRHAASARQMRFRGFSRLSAADVDSLAENAGPAPCSLGDGAQAEPEARLGAIAPCADE